MLSVKNSPGDNQSNFGGSELDSEEESEEEVPEVTIENIGDLWIKFFTGMQNAFINKDSESLDEHLSSERIMFTRNLTVEVC